MVDHWDFFIASLLSVCLFVCLFVCFEVVGSHTLQFRSLADGFVLITRGTLCASNSMFHDISGTESTRQIYGLFIRAVVRPAGLETNISAFLKVLGTHVHKGIHVTQTIPFTVDFW